MPASPPDTKRRAVPAAAADAEALADAEAAEALADAEALLAEALAEALLLAAEPLPEDVQPASAAAMPADAASPMNPLLETDFFMFLPSLIFLLQTGWALDDNHAERLTRTMP